MASGQMQCILCHSWEHVDHMGQKTTKRSESNYPVCRRCRLPARLQQLWDELRIAEGEAFSGDQRALAKLRRLRDSFELQRKPKPKPVRPS